MAVAVVFFAWLIFTTSVTLGKKQGTKVCVHNDHCPRGECCLRGQCTPWLSVGQRCNIVTQILSMQCPCEIGSSCVPTKDTTTFEKGNTFKCHSIIDYEHTERTEDMDKFHINSNTIDN